GELAKFRPAADLSSLVRPRAPARPYLDRSAFAAKSRRRRKCLHPATAESQLKSESVALRTRSRADEPYIPAPAKLQLAQYAPAISSQTQPRRERRHRGI